MKKNLRYYIAGGLVGLILVVGFYGISQLIQARKVYHLSVATLLSSYRENPLAFKRKYHKHTVYLTGRVYYVFEKGADDYVFKPGTAYQGSFVQLMNPSISPTNDILDFYNHSIPCGFYNKNLPMFQGIHFQDPLNLVMMTVKGTLIVNYSEVILIDCTKAEDEKKKEQLEK